MFNCERQKRFSRPHPFSLFSNNYFEQSLSLKRGDLTLLSFNTRNEHDMAKFTEDFKEAIAESDEMLRGE
jgi:hypothetical protein